MSRSFKTNLCVCVCVLTFMARGNRNRTENKFKIKIKKDGGREASNSEVFGQKDNYYFVVFADESNQCCFLSASPPLAAPPTMLSSWGCGDNGPSEMYSSMRPEVVRGLLTSTLVEGKVLTLEGGLGREGNELFVLFCF